MIGDLIRRRIRGKGKPSVVLSAIAILAMTLPLIVPIVETIKDAPHALAGLLCSHLHEESCYAVPEEHISSEEAGCLPVYGKKTVVVTEGHTHGDDCYELIYSHTHGNSCYGRGSDEPVCGEQESGIEKALVCGLEESTKVTEEIDDTDSEPVGWNCAVEQLVCGHKDCEYSESCLLEQESGFVNNESGEFSVLDSDGTLSQKNALLTGASKYDLFDSTGKYINTYGELYWVLYYLTTPGKYTIKLNYPTDTLPALASEYVEAKLLIKQDYDITLTSSNGQSIIKQEILNRRHISVKGSLTLKNIILEGVGTANGYSNGGVNVESTGKLTIEGGAIIRNCYNTQGGGVSVSSGGTLNISGGTISGNTSAQEGGGVYMASSTWLDITSGSTIKDNVAQASGGGIYSASSKPTTIGGATISGNYAGTSGGGICMVKSDNTISETKINESTISGNWTSNSGLGGGIYSPISSTKITISGNTMITGNGIDRNGTAKTWNGGGIFTGGTLEIKSGATISGNKATDGGGGVYASVYGNLYVSNGVVFANNNTPNAYNRDPKYDGIYEKNILCTEWTYPFKQGFNNWDIYQTGTTTSGIYAVEYKGNGNTGGSVPIDNTLYKNGNQVTVLAKGTLVRNGHKFIAWNTSPNGNGTSYSPGSTLNINNNHVVLYAQWAVGTPTVTYKGNGGLPEAQTKGHDDGTALIGPAEELKNDGYVFTGWNTAADGSGESYTVGGTLINNDVTLYAQWQPEHHNIPSLAFIPDEISFGVGTIPVRNTLFGLKDALVPTSSSKNYVVNEGASNVAKLEFGVMYPEADAWSLVLHCTPFTANGKEPSAPGEPFADVVAVNRYNGNIITNPFADNATVLMYCRYSFMKDKADGEAKYGEAGPEIGSWTWDRFEHDIMVEAHPGGYDAGTYKSTFTWTIQDVDIH